MPALETTAFGPAWTLVAGATARLVLTSSRVPADRADQAKGIRYLRRGVVALLEGHPLLVDGDASSIDVGPDAWFVLMLVDALRDRLERLELKNEAPNRDVERLL